LPHKNNYSTPAQYAIKLFPGHTVFIFIACLLCLLTKAFAHQTPSELKKDMRAMAIIQVQPSSLRILSNHRPIIVEIIDENGKVICKLSGESTAGFYSVK
jgi:hypothetical protein